MDAIKYFEEKRRMLNSLGKNGPGCVGVLCGDCPFSSFDNGMNISCAEIEIDYPEEAVAIIEKWSQEHPRKTMLSDLLEKYPKVSLEKNGTPVFCPEELGYCEKAYCDINDLNCVKCWNRQLEE